MPYIKPDYRKKFEDSLDSLRYSPFTSPGELNYFITEICLGYLGNKGKSYQTFNDIMGALEGCKMEFYRRKVAGYEDGKIIQNGDVYE